MIKKLASIFANKLSRNSAVNIDRDVCEYGLIILFSYVFYTMISILSGIVLNCLFESIILYISFQMLRKFAGGYHAKSEYLCELLSTSSIFLSCVSIKLLQQLDKNIIIVIVLLIVSNLVIIIFAPVIPLVKDLDIAQIKHNKQLTIKLLIVIDMLILIAFVLQFARVYTALVITLLFESITVIFGIYQHKKNGEIYEI